jgi:hypothetical protein
MNWAKELGQKEEALRLRVFVQEECMVPTRWTLRLSHRGEC